MSLVSYSLMERFPSLMFPYARSRKISLNKVALNFTSCRSNRTTESTRVSKLTILGTWNFIWSHCASSFPSFHDTWYLTWKGEEEEEEKEESEIPPHWSRTCSQWNRATSFRTGHRDFSARNSAQRVAWIHRTESLSNSRRVSIHLRRVPLRESSAIRLANSWAERSERGSVTWNFPPVQMSFRNDGHVFARLLLFHTCATITAVDSVQSFWSWNKIFVISKRIQDYERNFIYLLKTVTPGNKRENNWGRQSDFDWRQSTNCYSYQWLWILNHRMSLCTERLYICGATFSTRFEKGPTRESDLRNCALIFARAKKTRARARRAFLATKLPRRLYIDRLAVPPYILLW